jgi:hypothetical protein
MNTRTIHTSARIAIIALVFASLVTAGVVTAQQLASSTEPEGSPAAKAADRTVTYDSATSIGLPPDENPRAGSARSPNAPNVTFKYYQVSGATLRGRNSTTGYVYDSAGCSHVTAGTGTGRILNTELPLPDGSVIKYLRVYYRDTNAANGVEGYITRYQPGTGSADLIHTGSSDAFVGGYGFVVSADITEEVNNTIYAYTLIGWPDDVNFANQICGLRVAYYTPTLFAFLPTILSD